MTIADMRSALLTKYEGEAWRKKVMRMPDNQVFAVYKRISEEGFKRARGTGHTQIDIFEALFCKTLEETKEEET